MHAPKHRRHTPPADDRKLRRCLLGAIAEGFVREALVIILREVWRGGPW
jgi:hypothetical protein